MGYLVFITLSVVLLASFLLLSRREVRIGARYLENRRAALDARVTRLQFIAEHVDFEAFLREQLRVLAAHVAHDIAHLSLVSVRSIERLLSRLVRHLRTRHGIETATAVAPRAFVKTMSDFKQTLAAARPPIPEI